MKIGWGWKIMLLYTAFAVMIVTLVVASSRQKFDLVSKDYYQEEIAYQKVLDASKNQSGLAGRLQIHASGSQVVISFPAEFNGKVISGSVKFYSAVKQEWDRTFQITTNGNEMTVPRAVVASTSYTVKVSYTVDGKAYYQENDLNLHP